MPYTLYELANGQQFHYDTLDNSIRSGGELLNLPPLHSPEWYEIEAARHGTGKKTNAPIAVRLLLGHACNYSCVYCMQKDIGNPLERGRNMQMDKFKEQFKDIVKSMPSLAIFLLPGGALLLPLVLKVIPDLVPSAFRDNKIEE